MKKFIYFEWQVTVEELPNKPYVHYSMTNHELGIQVDGYCRPERLQDRVSKEASKIKTFVSVTKALKKGKGA